MRNYDYREVRDFRKQGHADVERIIKTKRPLVLTTKGKPEVVIQDLGSFQQMIEKLQAVQSILAEPEQ
jgi:PHD/YefM family antitoxin component YafN of YafNO toxin-antitoxin module